MMLIQNINAWLQTSSDYMAGLDLLRQTGFSGFVLGILAKGEDAYTRSRLEQELTNWLALPNNVSQQIPERTRLTNDNSVTEPAGVTRLKQDRSRLLDERAELKARLRLGLTTEIPQDDRRDWAFRIKAITRELDEVYSQLGFFDEYGYLPPPAADPAAIVDDTALLLNVRTYVSRYRAKVKAAKTPEARQQAQTLLDQYEAEKARLEKKRNRDAV